MVQTFSSSKPMNTFIIFLSLTFIFHLKTFTRNILKCTFLPSEQYVISSLVIYPKKDLVICFALQSKKKVNYPILILSEEESACADWVSYFLFTHQPHQFPFCSTPIYFLHYSKNDLKSDCITQLLKAPRCFPIEHRIRYKLLTKAFKDGMRERVKMRGEGYEMSLRWNQGRSWLCPSHLSNSSHTST